MKTIKSVRKAVSFIAASLVELVMLDSMKLDGLDTQAASGGRSRGTPGK